MTNTNTIPSPSSSTKPFDFATCLSGWDNARPCFRATPTADPAAPKAPTSSPAPGITIADLAQFAPAPTVIAAEPDGAGVARLPVNFTTAAETHTQTGTLLGAPITVRFSPVAYDFDFGDATSATLTHSGRTWTELGQRSLTPTPSSHSYAASGTYTVHLGIRYAAEIDDGAGWTRVPGLLTVESPPLDITVYEAHTALVAQTCTERPSAPGC
ncbi:MAG: hypothetical protein J7484_00480 [Microbacterium sp.]|nr:hypothetical protein [Microbacterium sp.]